MQLITVFELSDFFVFFDIHLGYSITVQRLELATVASISKIAHIMLYKHE